MTSEKWTEEKVQKEVENIYIEYCEREELDPQDAENARWFAGEAQEAITTGFSAPESLNAISRHFGCWAKY
jgi:hypothetical protein